MKIAHVLDTLEMGGAERIVLTLSAMQCQAGHHVEVHFLFGSGSLEPEFRLLGIPVYSAASSSTLGIINRLTANFKTTRPDVAHLHNAAAGIYGIIAAVRSGVPVRIVTRHGRVPPSGDWRTEGKFWLAAYFAQRVVAVSTEGQKNMLVHPAGIRSRVDLIVNGCEPARLSSHPLPRDPAHFTLVHVARLNPVKAQDVLLEAFARAVEQVPRLRLTIIGDGQLRSACEQRAQDLHIADRVYFAGERDNVGDWLAASDVFVLSSLTEGTPVALLEALSAGLPAIVTSVGEMPAIVRDNACGWVAAPGSAADLAAAMIGASSTPPAELEQLSRNAREAYAAHYQPQAMLARYMQLYEQSLASSLR